jgi:eukaryotic-like serine/threonine-protein kinase
MIQCNPQWAQRLLSNELTDQEIDQFENHLEQCPACQALLVEVSGGQSVLATANAMFASSVELAQWESSVKLPETAYGPIEHPAEKTYSYASDLSILGPSDDPKYVGRIGNYEVQGIIGRGGMGIVFRAFDRALHRNVAVKVLDPSMASIHAARQRFALEARAMAAISHEHVVPVYTVDEHRGLPYFAMEYIPGGTLESRIRQQGGLELLAILRISRQIALALSAAHECGLVHRDIKPANVLVDRGVERIRVTDFGLARVNTDASHTRSGFVAGTPQFMSPEQVRGEMCTEQSDLFSLGSVMYAMCTGKSPFHCDTMYGAMQRVVLEQPASIRELAPKIPEWMERFIFKLMEKSPQDRFQNAAMVAELLEQEIAYHQNPIDSPKPLRTTFEQVIAPNSSRGWWLDMGVVMAIILVVLTIGFVRNVKPIAPTPDTVNVKETISWNVESTQSIREGIRSLQRKTYSSEPTPNPDTWSRDVRDLKNALDAFEKSSP